VLRQEDHEFEIRLCYIMSYTVRPCLRMRPIETILRRQRIKENDGGGKFDKDISIFVSVTMYL
jgi:hypothetical protein